MIRHTVVVLAAAIALAAVPAAAQEGEAPSVIPPRQVISIQPVHAILGWYSAEYERVVAPTTTIGVTGAYFDWEGESTYVSAEGTLRYYPSADALDGLAFGMTFGPTFVTDRETYYYYGVAVEPMPYDVVPPMREMNREHFRAIGFGFEISRPYSPYGTQMFFTCVASRRNSSPRPARVRPVAPRPWLTQVRFMLPAERRSTSPLPSAPPKYQTPSTSSCAASVSASSSRTPVTMLTTPPGTSEVSSTW
jgi:hypothetical protein